MRVVTRAFSMASTVSGSPGPVPGAGGNWALTLEAKISSTHRRRQKDAQPELAVTHRPAASAHWEVPDGKSSLGGLCGRRGKRPFIAKARLHEKNSESQKNHE